MVARADRGPWHVERHRDRAARLIAYFDTSALAKLLLVEPASAHVRRVWRETPGRASSVALVPETRAALAAAHRSARIDETELIKVVGVLERLWQAIDGIELTERLALRAGELAQLSALRGYDAIHLASAEAILDEGDVMVVSDVRLARAAASIGIEALVPVER